MSANNYEELKFSLLPKARRKQMRQQKEAYRRHCMRMSELVLADLSWGIFARRAQESYEKYVEEAGLG